MERNDPMSIRDTVFVQYAKIEEIFIRDQIGYVTISYEAKGDFNRIYLNVVTLITDHDTGICNQAGRRLNLKELRQGAIINAEFSSSMTRSIPPQARAFQIMVLKGEEYPNVRIDNVIEVDLNNCFLYTGNQADIYSQMRFVITDETILLDRRDNCIRLRNIKPGQTVRVEHASFQTASIPPQTTAFRIRII